MIFAWAILGVAVFFAAIAAYGFAWNAVQYKSAPQPQFATPPRVSLLIPARNEEASIGRALEAALASRGVELEVLVRDDQSTDATAAIVQQFAERDPRVRLLSGEPLPSGWCGKQRSCQVLADAAQFDLLVFQDADVRLAPDALARLVAFLEKSDAGLVSGVPRQETGTWMEKLVIPLIHVVLLCYLPMQRMRQSTDPSYAAGCGQLFLARRSAYQAAGGHAAIRTSLHDGLTLPRAFRRAGQKTDLCDATDLATCRMYKNAAEVWSGLSKNATEGMGSPALIAVFTLLLGFGHIAPPLLLAGGLAFDAPLAFNVVAALATALPLFVRGGCAWLYRQSWLGVVFHPIGVAILLAIQWWALLGKLLGWQSTWKGRAYANPGAAVVET